MTNKLAKKDLLYSNFDELEKICNEFDFRKLDFNKPTICNSLLKLYDEGNKHLNDGEEEKAYIMLIRFFEGVVRLRKSKTYKDDKKYVDNFIPDKKLGETMDNLEKLKTDIKARYESKLVQSVTKPTTTSNDTNIPTPLITNGISKITINSVEKKCLNPKELTEMINKAIYKLLIIDIRPKNEFEYSHMCFDILFNDDKKRNLVSYINIPAELIENVSWNIYESLKAYEKQKLLTNSDRPQSNLASKIFSDRNQFDYLILFDKETSYGDMKSESKLAIFKRAVFEYDTEKCKSEPLILDGGWKQWIMYYPAYVSSTASSQQIDPNIEKKSSANKLYDFDYPDVIVSKVKIAPPSSTKQLPQPQPQPPQQSQSEIKQQEKQEPSEDEKAKKLQQTKEEINESQNSKPPQSQLDLKLVSTTLRPNINRNNKPGNLTNMSTNITNSAVNETKVEETSNNQEGNKVLQELKPNIVNNPINASIAPISKKQETLAKNEENIDISAQTLKTNVPKPFKNSVIPTNESSDIKDMIFNSIYTPARPIKPIQTPYMQEGSTKVLNNQTGLFSYNPPNNTKSSVFKPVQTPTAQPEPPAQQKPLPKTLPPSNKMTSGIPRVEKSVGSNLKRTFSSPNIAKLDDQLEIDEEEEKKNIINNLNQPDFNKIQSKNTTIRPSEKKETIKQPTVNRNNKPMPEHVMLARINELQPVFGNAHPGLTGIRNLGNTCFINSVLQCLNSTEKLVNYFLSGQHRQDLNRSNELGFRGEIADEFSVIVKAIWDNHCRIISPKRFKLIIGQFNQQFISNEQQDAQELLLFLLDGLHEDLNRVTNRPKLMSKDDENENLNDQQMATMSWNIHLSINNSIIVDLFQGQFKSTVNCLSCRKKSVKFDAFMYLTLPILSNRCDIYQCIELFLQPERMSGESKWKCPKCKEYRDATKKIDIWKLPPLLVIHLKRFKYHGLWRDKITTNVDYPIDNLNLDKYILGNDSKSKQNNYNLYAISNHSGTLDGGHYTAMCRHFEHDRWFKFDDTDVKEINSTSSLKSPLSYILFYSR